jgi:hypothetical protein
MDMDDEDRVTYEASLGEPVAGEPPRLYVWVRRFHGEDELTGRYEIFDDLGRFDDFIARVSATGGDVGGLSTARQRFAESLRKA